jgi:hypothetical protein
MKNNKNKIYAICDQSQGDVPYIVVPTQIPPNNDYASYSEECERIEKELGLTVVFTSSEAELITFLNQIKVMNSIA